MEKSHIRLTVVVACLGMATQAEKTIMSIFLIGIATYIGYPVLKPLFVEQYHDYKSALLKRYKKYQYDREFHRLYKKHEAVFKQAAAEEEAQSNPKSQEIKK